MDAMNRTLGLQLLIEMSLDDPTRQLILLSPQVRFVAVSCPQFSGVEGFGGFKP